MEKILEIISKTFNVSIEKLNAETKMQDIDSWDSLTHMEMIANLEEELEIEFSADDIVNMVDISSIVKIVEDIKNGR